MTVRLFFISAMLTALSCNQSPPLTKQEGKQVTDSVSVMLHNYYNDIKTNGLTAEFKYLDNSPDFFWVPPGYSSAISYDSVAIILNQNAPVLKSTDNSFESLRIIPLDRNIATYTARIRSTVTDTAGKVSTFSLVESGVVIKRKDGWKLLSGQTSIVP
jgi:hypothetical protein